MKYQRILETRRSRYRSGSAHCFGPRRPDSIVRARTRVVRSATVALDLDARHEALRTVCRDALDGWIATIALELPWSDEAVRRSFAEMVVAGLEGAFILSRARQSGTPFITVGEWLATILEQLPRNALRRTTRKHKRRHRGIPRLRR